MEPTRLQEPAIYSQILIKTLSRQGFRNEESSASQVLYLRNSCFYNYLETLVTKCWLIHFLLLVSPYTWYGKTRVTSCELRVESLKARVKIQKHELKFKSASYKFKSTSYEIESMSYEFESTSSRIIKSLDH